jgi:hypothetical protein
MPDDRHISLQVQDQPSSGTDGFTNAIASDGTIYSYQFSERVSGHDHIGGNVSFTTRGFVKITVKLPPGGRFTVDYVTFANDVNEQISWKDRSSPFAAEIHNKNDALANAYYLVTVLDTDKDYCTIPCDPMIINR